MRNPGFVAALQEMAALGLQVTASAHRYCTPYAVLSGRRQQRWYLLPYQPRAVRCASLALLQPLRRGPRLLKRAIAGAAWLGLPQPSSAARVYVSGRNRIAGVFGAGVTHAAFLTGTAGPHRKLTAQFMGAEGAIKGYAKVASTAAARTLLANEAATLAQLHTVDLHSAVLPRMLLHAPLAGDATVLATDTVPALPGGNRARLGLRHLAFLDELATRTAGMRVPDGTALLDGWRLRVRNLASRLSAAWYARFENALATLTAAPELIAPRGLAHGDFSPSNTFPYRDRLYVFDWEYAGCAYPADYDLIGFLFALHGLHAHRPDKSVAGVETMLTRSLGRPPRTAHARVVAYACIEALQHAERQSDPTRALPTWTGERAAACRLDALALAARRYPAAATRGRSQHAV